MGQGRADFSGGMGGSSRDEGDEVDERREKRPVMLWMTGWEGCGRGKEFWAAYREDLPGGLVDAADDAAARPSQVEKQAADVLGGRAIQPRRRLLRSAQNIPPVVSVRGSAHFHAHIGLTERETGTHIQEEDTWINQELRKSEEKWDETARADHVIITEPTRHRQNVLFPSTYVPQGRC